MTGQQKQVPPITWGKRLIPQAWLSALKGTQVNRSFFWLFFNLMQVITGAS